jgi:hypothetical protein
MDEVKGREARLKPEFAYLYPPLEGGRWESAAILADRMVSWLLRQHRGHVSPSRVLRTEHFDFRHGSATHTGVSRREDALGG